MNGKPQKVQDEENRKYIEAIEGFDGTEFLFDGGYKMTINLKVADITEDCPHGYNYEFNLFAPDPSGKPVIRVLATDNAHAPIDKKHPHDHWHASAMNPAGARPIGVRKGTHVKVNSIEDHLARFMEASGKLLNQLGLSSDIKVMTHEPRASRKHQFQKT